MNRFFLVLLCSAFIASVRAEVPVTPASDYYLSRRDVESFRRDALRGNVQAANRLSMYYSIYENDLDVGEFWLRVAAESGDCNAVEELLYRASTGKKPNGKPLFYWKMRRADLSC